MDNHIDFSDIITAIEKLRDIAIKAEQERDNMIERHKRLLYAKPKSTWTAFDHETYYLIYQKKAE